MTKTILKDFPVWKTITIGTMPSHELISRILGEKRVDEEIQIILDRDFDTSIQPIECDIVLANTDELEVPRGEDKMLLMVRFADIEKTILGYGYERLTLEMLLHLRLAHHHEEWISYYLFPLIEPYTDTDGDPILPSLFDHLYDEEADNEMRRELFFGSWVKAHIMMVNDPASRRAQESLIAFMFGVNVKLHSFMDEPWFSAGTNWLFAKPPPPAIFAALYVFFL